MVTFIIVLSILVLFHELGHYLAARLFDVRVESFSIGFGPRLIGFKRNGTDFMICLLPLGGYVKMAGGFGDGIAPIEPGDLSTKPRWQRLIIIMAGPVFNFVLALALLTGLYMHQFQRPEFLAEEARIGYVRPASPAAAAGIATGDVVRSIDSVPVEHWQSLYMVSTVAAQRSVPVEVERDGVLRHLILAVPGDDLMSEMPDIGWAPEGRVLLTDIVVGSPAAEAGIEPGDILLSIDGEPIVTTQQVVVTVGSAEGRALAVTVDREGTRRDFQVAPRFQEDAGAWRLGVGLRTEHDQISEPLSFQEAFRQSVKDNYGFAGMIVRTLRGLAVGQFSVKTLEGPVGLYRHTQEAAAIGFGSVILLMALISMNLGILNLAPIPVLDGGQILLLLVESLLRRDVSVAVRARITQAGIVLVLLLFGVVMYNDVMRQFFGP